MHLWLTPFTPGAHHFIFLEFDDLHTVAMIRIWVSFSLVFIKYVKLYILTLLLGYLNRTTINQESILIEVPKT